MQNSITDWQTRLQRLDSEAHVWYARPDDITDSGQLANYAAWLSEEEQSRHRRFHFVGDRHTFLVSHALVRRVLSLYADVEPSDWRFAFNQHGRPEIAGTANLPPLRFNLSHTAGLVACVVTLNVDCGIDVERIVPRGNPLAIAAKMFAAKERQVLNELGGRALLERFFTYWTLREAYCKALGTGLARASDYDFDVGQDDQVRISFAEQSNDCSDQWRFTVHRPGSGHIVAVALHTGPLEEKTVVCEFIVP